MAKAQRDMEIRPGYEQRADAANDPRLDWWRRARFGMFIHWGLYALDHRRWAHHPETVIHHWTGEWVQHVKRIPHGEYRRAAAEFNPVAFDADAWVDLAIRAGMKYMVLTAKHHDGFCLFKSDVTDFNIVDAAPFGRDIVEELAAACRKRDLPLGLYYSQTADWSQPDGGGNDWDFDPAGKDFQRYQDEIVKPHLRELLTRYGPIALVWFDTPGELSIRQSQELAEVVHQLQPECLVSGRIGNGVGDYASFRDNRIPGERPSMDWESPATMNRTWGYVADDTAWKPAGELLWTLLDTVSKGGNLLLNVGPDGRGEIPPASVDILEQMGHWLKINGEAIYGTCAGRIQDVSTLRCTEKESRLFLHVITWPRDGKLRLELPDLVDRRIRLVADGTPLTAEDAAGGTLIPLPAERLADLPLTIAAEG
jgi:alpha-L-fucosidase